MQKNKRVRCLYVKPAVNNKETASLDLQEALCHIFARKQGWSLSSESYSSLFFDDDWTVEILDLYDLALQGIKITDDESTNRWYLEETIKKKEEQVNE